METVAVDIHNSTDLLGISQLVDSETKIHDGRYWVDLPRSVRQRMKDMGRHLPTVSCLPRSTLIGMGTYGVVHGLRVNDAEVAVKIFHEALTDPKTGLLLPADLNRGTVMENLESGHLRDFLMSQTCGQLPHCVPFVASALCFESETPAIVTPRFRTDLDFAMQCQGLDASHRHQLLGDLLTALAYMHAHGLLHRDVKPSNCFIDGETSRLYLGDFNLTRTVATAPGHTVSGFEEPLSPTTQTIMFRSPEVALHSRQYTRVIDCFSVGMIWFEMLAHQMAMHDIRKEDDFALLYSLLRVLGPPSAEARAVYQRQGVSEWRLQHLEACIKRYQETNYPMGYELQAVLKRCCCDEEAKVLAGLLDWNPDTRWTAVQALQSPYFATYKSATISTADPAGNAPVPTIFRLAAEAPPFLVSPFVVGAESRTRARVWPGGENPAKPEKPENPCRRRRCRMHHDRPLNGQWNRAVPRDPVLFWPWPVPPMPAPVVPVRVHEPVAVPECEAVALEARSEASPVSPDLAEAIALLQRQTAQQNAPLAGAEAMDQWAEEPSPWAAPMEVASTS